MILNNYWKAMDILANIITDGRDHRDSFNMKDINGVAPSIQHGTYSYYATALYSNVNLRDSLISARIGTGTGEISPTDYSLFADCTSNISNLTVTSETLPTDEGYSQIMLIRGNNNTSEEITITEVGITKTFYSQNSQDVLTDPVMFAKMLLENPITVRAGEAFLITLEWVES